MKKSGFFCWHVHPRILLELCDNYDERVKYIRTGKTSDEKELLLRLFRPVKGQLPKEVLEAQEAYIEAERPYTEAKEAFGKLQKVYAGTRKSSSEALKTYIKTRGTSSDALKVCDEARRDHFKARRALFEARKDCDKAEEIYFEARRAYNNALSAHKDEIEALHAKECLDCPWDGNIISPAA